VASRPIYILPLSASPWIESAGVFMEVYSQLRLGVSCLLRVDLATCSGVCLIASGELTSDRTVKQVGSVSSSAIGSVLDSALRSVLESVLGTYLGVYSQAGLQLGVSLRLCPGVYLRTYWEVYLGV